jgi:L-2-hydroxycarboxylate dehydrogenase (NAD+)
MLSLSSLLLRKQRPFLKALAASRLSQHPSLPELPHKRSFVADDTDERSKPEVGMVHVTIEEATAMTRQALIKIGWDEEDASTQAEIMVAAELCGNNQGLVKMYQPSMMAPSPKRGGKPIIARETPISAVIDAQQSPGMIAAMTASNTVAQKIKSSGLPIAIACSHNSSTSSGQLAHYVERMARHHGLIGLACGNSPEFVAAAPGARPVLGTNPLAVSIPTLGDPFTVRCGG